MNLPSTKPYMIRAIHEWCCDNGFTPYIAVIADKYAQVPQEFVRDGQIVLNVGYDAANNLMIGNEWITFKARFSGVARELVVPINNVAAIYARESGAGMSFEVEYQTSAGASPELIKGADDFNENEPHTDSPVSSAIKRPKLQRIK